MKNLKLVFFFGVALILLLTFQSQAQEIIHEQAPGLFERIWTWAQGGTLNLFVGFLVGFLVKGGYTALIKKAAQKGAVVTKELGDLFADSSTFFNSVDKAIKDDGSVDQSSIAGVIAAGKEVIAEGKDVIVSIKPK